MARQTEPSSRARVEKLITRYGEGWQALNRALAGLPDFADEEPNISKQWNVKDVVGHLLAYYLLMARHLDSIKKRGRLSSPRSPSYSYFNKREAARYKSVPFKQLWAELEDAYYALIPRIEKLTDADLSKKYKSGWSDSTYVSPLGSILREESTHTAAHAREIQQWRQRYGL